MTLICDKAKSTLCPYPRNCLMAEPHECATHGAAGDCLLPDGRKMRVRCVEAPDTAKGAAKGAASAKGGRP